MIAGVKRAEDQDFDCDADDDRGAERGGKPDEKRSGRGEGGGGNIGTDHVERAVRQIDQVHDAENQGQPGRHQKQHDPELDPVQHLLDDLDHGGKASRPRPIVIPWAFSPRTCSVGKAGIHVSASRLVETMHHRRSR